ncbi:MAG: hypothetical protein M3Y03_00215 [Verrucomicrobiota bacterium]|nr:hypothetical protein [Verrucomicrobiota bacterium]
MSDIGLPPGFGVWLYSLGWIIICAAGWLVCLLIAWVRARRGGPPFNRSAFLGWAIGAAVSALVAGLTIVLVNWSGSLGVFAHWIDQTSVTSAWLAGQITLWPTVALFWNSSRKTRAAR